VISGLDEVPERHAAVGSLHSPPAPWRNRSLATRLLAKPVTCHPPPGETGHLPPASWRNRSLATASWRNRSGTTPKSVRCGLGATGFEPPTSGRRPRLGWPLVAELDEHGRPEPPLAGNEVDTLLGFLDFQLATLAWKCGGLDMAGMTATVGPSSMTLAGMLEH
jgi:hypothetical protein